MADNSGYWNSSWGSKPSTSKKKSSSKSSAPSMFDLSKLLNPGNVLSNMLNQNKPSSLAELIEKQAANQDAQVQQTNSLSGAGDPFSSLANQLFSAANSIGSAGTPIEQLRKMASDQAALQYDPQIEALGTQMHQKDVNAQRSEKSARDMYGSLAKDYLSQLPEITSQYKAQDDSANQRYDQAQQQLSAQYGDNSNQQNAILKQLGIQAAAPDASKQSKEDQAYFQNSMESDQQNALNALAQQQMAQQDYQRNMGSNAKMTGENVAQDIGQQYSDYYDQAISQMNSLTSGKTNATAALLQQLQQQDAQNSQAASQQQFQNMMSLYNYQLDAAKASNEANQTSPLSSYGSGSGLSGITSGLPGASNYLASVYPNQPILTGNLMDLITKGVLQDPAVKNGKFVLDPGDPSMGKGPTYSPVGQEYMMNLLKQAFEKSGRDYNPNDITQTMAALQAYLGKLHS